MMVLGMRQAKVGLLRKAEEVETDGRMVLVMVVLVAVVALYTIQAVVVVDTMAERHIHADQDIMEVMVVVLVIMELIKPMLLADTMGMVE